MPTAIRSRVTVETAYTRLLSKGHFALWGTLVYVLEFVIFPFAGRRAPNHATWEIVNWMHSFTTLLWPFFVPLFFWKFCKDDFRIILLGRYRLWFVLLLGLISGIALELLDIFMFYCVLHRTSPTPQGPYTPYYYWLLICFLVWIPLSEEYCFQLIMQTQLQRFGTIFSILITTFFFWFVHPLNDLSWDSLQAWLPIVGGLLGFALLRRYSGSLLATILAHSVSNAVAFIVFRVP